MYNFGNMMLKLLVEVFCYCPLRDSLNKNHKPVNDTSLHMVMVIAVYA